MIKQPPYLKKGDKIAIVCPAKKLPKPIAYAVNKLQEWGLEVVLGETVGADFNQFAGEDSVRARDLQKFLDDASIRAIVAGRGGYGTVRIIDRLDFTRFSQNPKWIVGYSDITVLLSHILNTQGIQSIHGQMPYGFEDSTLECLESLHSALFGNPLSYAVDAHSLNKIGNGKGAIIGGNLTLLCMIEGSNSAIDFTDKILFIEDVAEQEFSIDRMMRMLKRSGKLAHLKGLIVGEFNEIEPEEIYFGQTPNEIIAEIVKEYDYPVCYGFPVGHINNNLSMVLGGDAQLTVLKNKTTLIYL